MEKKLSEILLEKFSVELGKDKVISVDSVKGIIEIVEFEILLRDYKLMSGLQPGALLSQVRLQKEIKKLKSLISKNAKINGITDYKL